MLRRGGGTDRIDGFEPAEDRFGLTGGLTPAGLGITPEGGDTLIAAAGEVLAVVHGVDLAGSAQSDLTMVL